MTRSTNSLLHNGGQFWGFFQIKNEMSNFTLTCFDWQLHSSSEVWLARRWTSPCDVLWRRESQVWSRQGFSWKVTLQFVTWRFHLVPHLSTKFVSQLFWLLAVVCGTGEGFYCFYQGFWEVLSGLVCRVGYAPWKVQLIKDKSATYQVMLLRKKCSHHSKHVKVRIKVYFLSCQEEGCRMFVDYQPDRLWCSWFLVTSGVNLCCFIWTTLWFSPVALKTSG